MKRDHRVFFVVTAACLAWGCGDDDARDSGPGDGGGAGVGAPAKDASTSPPDAGAMDASSGGSGGSSAGTAAWIDVDLPDEDGGAAEPCGAGSCAQPTCCADAFQSACGLQIDALVCLPSQTSTAMPNARCPSVRVMGGTFLLPSCCTADGECGIDARAAGKGCISLEQLNEYSSTQGGGGAGIDWPDPQACN